MKKYLQKKLNNEKGMTLIELLAVIVIIAIIAAIAIPAIGNIIDNSRVGAMKSDNLNAIAAAELFILDNPEVATVSLQNITGEAVADVAGTPGTPASEGYIDSKGSLQSFTYTKATKTVTSVAKEGKLTLTITGTDVTKTKINKFKNSDRSTSGNIKVTKE